MFKRQPREVVDGIEVNDPETGVKSWPPVRFAVTKVIDYLVPDNAEDVMQVVMAHEDASGIIRPPIRVVLIQR